MIGPQTTAQRTFAHRRILQVNPDGYLTGTRLLAAAIQLRLAPASAVIGIANGGLLPAQALGELLAVPVYRVDARHNSVHRRPLYAGHWPGGIRRTAVDVSAGRAAADRAGTAR